MADEDEEWHIANGSTVLIATAGNSENCLPIPGGVNLEMHESSAVGECKTKADLIIQAFVNRAYSDPAWLEDLIVWNLDRK